VQKPLLEKAGGAKTAFRKSRRCKISRGIPK